MENTTNPSVRKEVSVSEIIVSRVYSADYQKEGTQTAEVKQTIKTNSFYPTKSVSDNLRDNPFATKEFGFAEQAFESTETRVAWFPVPMGTTVEQVQAKIAGNKEACIYRILANKPILSDSQLYAIENGVTTKDIIADAQAVRYPANHPTLAGKLILDIFGKVQYKVTPFKVTATKDVDMRTDDLSDYYATERIKAELALSATHITIGQDSVM